MRNDFSPKPESIQSCKSEAIMHANINIAREKGADTKVVINSVTFVSKFREVCGVFFRCCSASSVSTIFMFLTYR